MVIFKSGDERVLRDSVGVERFVEYVVVVGVVVVVVFGSGY